MTQTLLAVKAKLLGRLFPEVSDATAETLDILSDIDQVTLLLASLDEKRHGRIVAMDQAFVDL